MILLVRMLEPNDKFTDSFSVGFLDDWLRFSKRFMMKVYFAPRSRAVRTVWLLEEIDQPYELIKFTLGQKEMRGPEYTAINPNGRVPTLVDGGVIISESTAIAQYLGAKFASHLTPTLAESNFPEYLQWLHYGEGMIMPPINNYVVETIFAAT
jgi:Glutathione S-transferase